MNIEISDSILQSIPISSEELKIELGCFLYEKNIFTLEQASKIADKDQLTFQKLLAKKQVPLHYGEDDFEDDLATLRKLGRI